MGKKAILIVHFGSTVERAREKSIGLTKEKFEESFKGYEIREAFTSKVIIKSLRREGVYINDPIQALEKLFLDGYTHIFVQMTNIINGIEYEKLSDGIKIFKEKHKNKFEKIEVGKPLLTKTKDYKDVVKAIGNEIKVSQDTAVVLVGHGTDHHSNSAYPALDYIFASEGYKNYFIGTVEGYPNINEIKSKLKELRVKNIILSPFMFVAGDHAMNDISIDWKTSLEEEGYNVSIVLKGLGEYESIQSLYAESLKELL